MVAPVALKTGHLYDIFYWGDFRTLPSCFSLLPHTTLSWDKEIQSMYHPQSRTDLDFSGRQTCFQRKLALTWPRKERPRRAPKSLVKTPTRLRLFTKQKCYLPFLSELGGIFQGLQLCERRIRQMKPQLSSIMPDIKETCKYVKQHHSSKVF